MSNSAATTKSTTTLGGDIGIGYWLPLNYNVGKDFIAEQ